MFPPAGFEGDDAQMWMWVIMAVRRLTGGVERWVSRTRREVAETMAARKGGEPVEGSSEGVGDMDMDVEYGPSPSNLLTTPYPNTKNGIMSNGSGSPHGRGSVSVIRRWRAIIMASALQPEVLI